MTSTALYTLRCLQVGLHMADLEQLSQGEIFDIFTEAQNDKYDYQEVTDQEDYDNF